MLTPKEPSKSDYLARYVCRLYSDGLQAAFALAVGANRLFQTPPVKPAQGAGDKHRLGIDGTADRRQLKASQFVEQYVVH